jgi:hypothetical protein
MDAAALLESLASEPGRLMVSLTWAENHGWRLDLWDREGCVSIRLPSPAAIPCSPAGPPTP